MKKISLNELHKGRRLTELLIENNAAPDSPCGGKGTCGKCKVKTSGKLSQITEKEKKLLTRNELSEGIRLACMTYCEGDAEVSVFSNDILVEMSTNTSNIETDSPFDLTLSENPVGMAVDIGTTTVAAFFYDLKTNKNIFTTGGVNPQRAFGADVLSRIDHVTNNKDGLSELQGKVASLLSSFIEDFSFKTGGKSDDIIGVTIAGNSTMELIFAGIDVSTLGYSPFTPKSLLGVNIKADNLGLKINEEAQVYFLPLISGFIGGDTVAAMLSLDFDRTKGREYVVDIGTNGEMAITDNDEIFACSTAAGPAFEGARIKFGMGSIPGAITSVKIENGKTVVETIGGKPPIGICGSGLISLMAELIKNNLIDETGVFNDDTEDFGTEDNETVFYISPDKSIYLTQKDIREVQLAKAAVSAGSLCLLKKLNFEKPEKAYVAGGFGAALDLNSAKVLGLLPKEIIEIAEKTGNSAGAGAILCLLSKNAQKRAEALSKRVTVIELSGDPYFEDQFVENMFF